MAQIEITEAHPHGPQLFEARGGRARAVPMAALLSRDHAGSTAVRGQATTAPIDASIAVALVNRPSPTQIEIVAIAYAYWAENPRREGVPLVSGVLGNGARCARARHILQPSSDRSDDAWEPPPGSINRRLCHPDVAESWHRLLWHLCSRAFRPAKIARAKAVCMSR
jgi:hypothetical protein